MTRPSPFTLQLTPAERERLEQHRVTLGKRSLADVVRHWIENGVWTHRSGSRPATTQELANYEAEAAYYATHPRVSVVEAAAAEFASRALRRPTPKPGSRLKKEKGK